VFGGASPAAADTLCEVGCARGGVRQAPHRAVRVPTLSAWRRLSGTHPPHVRSTALQEMQRNL